MIKPEYYGDDDAMLAWLKEQVEQSDENIAAVERANRSAPPWPIYAAARGDFRPLASAIRRNDKEAIDYVAKHLEGGGGVFKARRTDTGDAIAAVETARMIRRIWKSEYGLSNRKAKEKGAEFFAAKLHDVKPTVVLRRLRKGR